LAPPMSVFDIHPWQTVRSDYRPKGSALPPFRDGIVAFSNLERMAWYKIVVNKKSRRPVCLAALFLSFLAIMSLLFCLATFFVF
jgi:hypothetical protein